MGQTWKDPPLFLILRCPGTMHLCGREFLCGLRPLQATLHRSFTRFRLLWNYVPNSAPAVSAFGGRPITHGCPLRLHSPSVAASILWYQEGEFECGSGYAPDGQRRYCLAQGVPFFEVKTVKTQLPIWLAFYIGGASPCISALFLLGACLGLRTLTGNLLSNNGPHGIDIDNSRYPVPICH